MTIKTHLGSTTKTAYFIKHLIFQLNPNVHKYKFCKVTHYIKYSMTRSLLSCKLVKCNQAFTVYGSS